MTPEERQMLTDLANKVAQTPAPPVDSEAENFIRTRIGSRPDALYLMTQTVLIQNLGPTIRPGSRFNNFNKLHRLP